MIYIVTGPPRSGTSLVMQTLRLLGMHVHGLEFPPGRSIADNPRGYWEDRYALGGDLSWLAKAKTDVAVKVEIRSLMERAELDSAKHSLILCRRSSTDVAESQHAPGMRQRTWGSSTNARSAAVVDRFYNAYDAADWTGYARHEVSHAAMRSAKTVSAEIISLRDFVGLTTGIESAVANVEVR